MPKAKPAAPKRTRAAETVVAGQRDGLQSISTRTAGQAIAERDIYDGRHFLGTVRERRDGSFVAVFDEQVLGPHPTVKAATDALLELARPKVEP